MFRRDALRLGAGLFSGAVVGAGAAPAAAHPGPYQPYGSIDLEGAKEAVVGPDGTVFVATTTGYAAVDVSTPDRPEVLADIDGPAADRPGGPLRGIYDVKVDGDRLLVVGPANPRPGALAGVLVVDVSDPASPREVGFYETDYPIHNCYFADGYAYLTANDGADNPLVILDVDAVVAGGGGGAETDGPGVGAGNATVDAGTEGGPGDGEDAAAVGRWALVEHDPAWADVSPWARAIHDVWVHEGLAYLAHWDAGTWILDVSEPTDPVVVGNVPVEGRGPSDLANLPEPDLRRETTVPPGNHHYVATDEAGEILGIGREAWADDEGRGGPGWIDLFDVTDPAAPVHLSRIDPPATADPTQSGAWTTSHNFELRDDRLYSSWYQGGVKRHDLSDPANPREVTWWRDPDAARFWTARLVVPGSRSGYFVATSMGLRDAPARLYTFPDHAGTQADPPSLLATETPDPAVVTPTPAESGSGSRGDGSADARADGSAGTSGNPSGSAGSNGDDGGRPASTAPVPGFGAGAVGGAAGLLGTGWWLRSWRAGDTDREDEE